MIIHKKGEDAYFAASNSAEGFCSYYPRCFDAERIQRVYAVKGGPGTGKSFFLRAVAEAGEALGWDCEYIYCSSDPDSLDGVILTGEGHCVALADATAPHVYEPSLPGAREEIVDLGAFWDCKKLEARTEEIRRCNLEKSKAYQRAYRFLRSVGETARAIDEQMLPYIKKDAIVRFAEKQMRGIPEGEGYRIAPALIASVGMKGWVCLDSYAANADRVVWIKDYHGTAQHMMQALGELAVQKRLSVRISHDPICPEKTDGLFLCESKTAFLILHEERKKTEEKAVDMRRFAETARMQSVRRTVRNLERMREAMLASALDEMARVREWHFQLEAIYSAAMDFAKKEAFTKSFCEKLFHLPKDETCDTI